MRATLCALALLALASGARAHTASEDCGEKQWLIPKELRRPKMTVTANLRSCPDLHRQGECTIPYGGDTTVTILCSSDDARNLHMHALREEIDLETDQLNSTTIQLSLKGLQGGWESYMCKDDKNNCENSILVNVDVMMSVSPTDYYRVDADGEDSYFVIYQDNYEVFCRAENSELIVIETGDIYDSLLPLEILNETTAKVKRRADHIGEELYVCHGDFGAYSKRMLNVVVDYHAAARDFRCIFYIMLKLECKWTSSSKRNVFKLFYIFTNLPDRSHFICGDNTGDIAGSCTWNNKLFGRTIVELRDPSLNLLLQTCNEFYCNNQTFDLNPREITRLDSISDLRLVSRSTRGAILTWCPPFQFRMYTSSPEPEIEYTYKVQYRLTTAWRQVNSSAVVCNDTECKFHLELPCPDWRYQVQVYVKLAQAAERFWSEPASLYVFTDPQNTADAMNPECYAALPEPEPITSADTAASEIAKLLTEVINKKIAMKKKLSGMRLKVAEVNNLMESLAKLDED